jgi:hypothetical protein
MKVLLFQSLENFIYLTVHIKLKKNLKVAAAVLCSRYFLFIFINQNKNARGASVTLILKVGS